MIIVQDILISDDVIEEHFMCNLNACKGACCWEGDFGAPLEEEEMKTLDKIYKDIKPFLSKEGRKIIAKKGKYTYYDEPKEYGTPLINGRDCAYLTYDLSGIAQCGIEKAFKAGITDFRKPISCHLYPVRVNSDKDVHFEALNYDRWDICSAACQKGKESRMPVFRFVKDALIRKYGQDFYDELEAAADFIKARE